MSGRLRNFGRALRLPFITASILPFIFGSFLRRGSFNARAFVLGLISVAATHLSANLLNDYADSRSGADWHDRNFYTFFGGSKLIQENVFSEKFYLNAAIVFSLIALLSVVLIAIIIKSVFIIAIYGAILFLAMSYSAAPFRFCYRRLGEVIIFILFGPALVMGGYFIQTRTFPALESFLLSLPFGFLTVAILFVNEVPDLATDTKAGKLTWAGIVGAENAYIVYFLLVFLAFLSIAANIVLEILTPAAFFSFIFAALALRATAVLKRYPHDKMRLIESSKLTVLLHGLVSILLILAVAL